MCFLYLKILDDGGVRYKKFFFVGELFLDLVYRNRKEIFKCNFVLVYRFLII